MAAHFELVTHPDHAVAADARLLVWPPDGTSATVRASLDPWLGPLGPVPPAAIDLARVAATALIADRRTPRGQRGLREFRLSVHITDPSAWTAATPVATELLGFLTGDRWTLDLHPDRSGRPTDPDTSPGASEMFLFSGGLDSFCGAALALAVPVAAAAAGSPGFVAHRDSPVVAAAQRRASAWITANLSPTFMLQTHRVAQAQPKLEPTERSRSLLFAALGIASTAGRGATRLQVPENGWTSLNPPLRANRGGWLSTRSTHPQTFTLLGELLGRLGVAIDIANPHGWLTKGELVRAAAQTGAADFPAGVADTLSCAKLDGRLYAGGHPGLNCGLCVACLVRRSAIQAAGVPDRTAYLMDRLTGPARKLLLERRRPDFTAVRMAVAAGVDESALLAAATLPQNFDVDRALELWQRGLKELADVDLP
jgi:Queuosine biosynthesis protein QueC